VLHGQSANVALVKRLIVGTGMMLISGGKSLITNVTWKIFTMEMQIKIL